MLGIGTYLSLLCGPVTVTNYTKVWTDKDQKVLERAKYRCPKLYKDAPCLVKFHKQKADVYHAVCGSGKDSKS